MRRCSPTSLPTCCSVPSWSCSESSGRGSRPDWLYERFQPDIPAGKKGWGAKGALDLGLIGRLAKERDERMLGGSPALLSGLPRAGVAELDAQRRGGQQAQAVKSAAGSPLSGCLGVAGAERAALPGLHRPAVLPQGDGDGFRPPE